MPFLVPKPLMASLCLPDKNQSPYMAFSMCYIVQLQSQLLPLSLKLWLSLYLLIPKYVHPLKTQVFAHDVTSVGNALPSILYLMESYSSSTFKSKVSFSVNTSDQSEIIPSFFVLPEHYHATCTPLIELQSVESLRFPPRDIQAL